MATFIPKTDTAAITNEGERLVAQALERCFDKSVLVYHSYPWLRPRKLDNSNREILQQGEIDFVVIHPDLGMLVLEVKGGEIELRADGTAVRHQGRRTVTLKESPFEQAQRNYQNLRNLFFEHPHFEPVRGEKKLLPFNSGFAVVFPTHAYEYDLPPSDGDPRIIIDTSGVEDIDKSIKRALEAWAGGPVGLKFNESDLKFSKEVMKREFRLIPVLWRSVAAQEEQLRRLTDEQCKILEILTNQRKAAIEGVAGSGKTMLAMQQVERLSKVDDAENILFVCYNRPLADWLNTQLDDALRGRVTIASYHQLCADWCKRGKVPFNRPGNNEPGYQDFWDYEAPELLVNAAALIDDDAKFDAVIVDEGQDFRSLWWDSLEKVFRPGNHDPYFYVFYDSKQNIFIENPTLPGVLGKPFPLPTNCRNTKRIADHAAGILGIEIPVDPKTPDGLAPTEIGVPGLDEGIRAAQKQVGQWLTKGSPEGGLKPDQVAILTGQGTGNDANWPAKIGNTPVVTNFDDWRAGKGVLRCNWRRFKGLEADAIVLTQSDRFLPPESDRYVATSRAKHLLTVVSIGQ